MKIRITSRISFFIDTLKSHVCRVRIYKSNITDFLSSILKNLYFFRSATMFVYRAHFMWFFLHYLKQLPGIIIVTFLEELVNFFP